MAENVILNNLANLQNDTTTISVINGNNATITSAFSDVLSRTGVQPNQMNTFLDMNNFPIMNLPAPGSANSPARLVDVTGSNPINISLSLSGDVTAPASSGVLTTTLTKTPTTSGNVLVANGSGWTSTPVTGAVAITSGGVTSLTNTGTSGHTIPFLDGNNTFSGNNIYSGNITFTGGSPAVSPSSGASVINLNAPASQQAVVVLETNGAQKWQVSKQTDDSFAISDAAGGFVSVATSKTGSGFFIKGSTTNDSAAAGFVGEYVTASVNSGSAISVTTATPLNITSVSLTAGDWDVWGSVYFSATSTTSVTQLQASTSTTSASMNVNPGNFAIISQPAEVPGANTTYISSGPSRFSLASTITVFLVAQATFTASTMTAYGAIQARRVR